MPLSIQCLQPFRSYAFPAVCLVALGLVGCGTPAGSGANQSAPDVATKDDHDHEHGHDHPSEGPHHGELVELGNEEYHAEVVHGTGDEVTVYILDGSAQQAVPTAATEIVMNFAHEGTATQFPLAAAPDSADPEGKSSRFATQDPEVAAALDKVGGTVKFVITIDGRQYTGKLDHHDH